MNGAPPGDTAARLSPEEQEERRRRFYASMERELAKDGIGAEGQAKTQPDPGTGPTPERMAHAGFTMIEHAVMADKGRSFEVYRMLDASPLDEELAAGRKDDKKGITLAQYSAGARYFESAYFAGVLASGVPDLTAVRVDGGQHRGVSDRRLDAAQKYAKALKALDRKMAAVLHHAVIMQFPLATWIEVSGYAARDRRPVALDWLRTALDRLDEHYNPKAPPQREGKIRAAGVADYKPYIRKAGGVDDR
jgi:hypothetical protein